MLALWVAEARASDLDARVSLYEGLLAEAYGDYDTAIARYTGLASTLPDDDQSLSESLYRLGHALYARGRTAEARQALVEGIRRGRCPECHDLLELLEIDESSVTTVPATWRLEAIVHPLEVQDCGSIRVAPGPDGDPALHWTTSERLCEPDRLVVGLRDVKPAPESFRFDIRSDDLDAVLDVEAEDVHGRRFVLTEPIAVPRATPRRVVVALSDLEPASPGPALVPSEVVLLWIVDRTSRTLGSNHFWLDDVELR
jgi:tetratricopeptide (TPR) repeat protein